MVRAVCFLPPLLAALTGCESEDPKIRQELAALRTEIGELQRKNTRLEAELKEARDKASRSVFLGRDVLSRNLEAVMPELRANLTRAFPDRKVDPVSPGTISTPLDEQGFPYNTELNFGISQKNGRGFNSYTINIKADRQGKWQMPDLRAMAAMEDQRSAGAGQPMQQRGPAADGPRVIDWGEQNAAASPAPVAPTAQPAPAPPAAPPPGPSQPAVQAPFPVQDSRTIRFD